MRQVSQLILSFGALASAVLGETPSTSVPLDIAVGLSEKMLQFNVTVDGKVWLASSPFGQQWTMGTVTRGVSGVDTLGQYNKTSVAWKHVTTGTPVITSFRHYKPENALATALEFPDGMKTADVHLKDMLGTAETRFPHFSSAAGGVLSSSAGVVYWSGNYAATGNIKGLPFSKLGSKEIGELGPVVLYEKYNETTVVLAAHNNFMTETHTISETAISCGPGLHLKELPAGFTQEYLIVAGPAGLSSTVLQWGGLMRRVHSPQRPKSRDLRLEKIGYWTDHGAAYYYWEMSKKTEMTMPNQPVLQLTQVMEKYKQLGIPMAYLQLDAWWYDTNPNSYSCIMNYTANPGGLVGTYPTGPAPYFAEGVKKFGEDLGVGLSLYHNYFCEEAVYFEKYQKDGNYSVVFPVPWEAEQMYTEMWQQGVDQGMIGSQWDYEEDIYAGIPPFDPHPNPHFQENVTWLSDLAQGMASAAEKLGIPLQYDMAFPRFVMESSKFPSVTNIRGSKDSIASTHGPDGYVGGTDSSQMIRAPYQSLFFHSVGLKGSGKDNIVYGNAYSAAAHLSVIITLLSGGPVGSGAYLQDLADEDGLDALRRAVTMDGSLLQATRPLMPIDYQFTLTVESKRELKDNGYIYESSATISGTAPYTTHQAFHFLGSTDFELQAGDFRPSLTEAAPSTKFVYRRWTHGPCVPDAPVNEGHCVHPLLTPSPKSSSDPAVTLHNEVDSKEGDFLNVFPVTNGMALLGEVDKWVPVSDVRFANIDLSSSGISVDVKGTPEEIVSVWAIKDDKIVLKNVIIPSTNITTVKF